MFGSIGLLIAFIFGSFVPGNKVDCKLPNGRVVRVEARVCQRLGGKVISPVLTPTPSPTPLVLPTSTPKPIPTVILAPTPTPLARPVIERIEVYDGTSGESTYGYVTGVKAIGKNIGVESRMTLVGGGSVHLGMYQGGDGGTWILSDFLGLPHCQVFSVTVTNNNGVATYLNGVSSVCP